MSPTSRWRASGPSAAGMTLVELLVGLMLALVGLAALTAIVTAVRAAWDRAGTGVESLEALTNAIDQMSRDIRAAGYDPSESGFEGVVTAAREELTLAADLDGDGVIDLSSEERVGYRRSATSDTLLRVVGTQVMPLISDLASDGFRLRYFDAAGLEIDPARPDASAAVRQVTIELTTSGAGQLRPIRLVGGARFLNR